MTPGKKPYGRFFLDGTRILFWVSRLFKENNSSCLVAFFWLMGGKTWGFQLFFVSCWLEKPGVFVARPGKTLSFTCFLSGWLEKTWCFSCSFSTRPGVLVAFWVVCLKHLACLVFVFEKSGLPWLVHQIAELTGWVEGGPIPNTGPFLFVIVLKIDRFYMGKTDPIL